MANSVRIGVGVSDNATKPITDIRSAFRALQQDGAKGLGIGLGAAVGLQAFNAVGMAIHEVTGALGDAVKGALEEEDSIARLTTALKANVPAWDGNTAAIESTLAARMRLGASDDEQRQSLALLVGATHDVNKALELQRTAFDLAALKRVDLATASEALIKVEGGQYRALKALGIVLKDGATATEALAAVQAVAEGQAESLANTTGGKLKDANIAISESMEKLGAIVLPLVAEGAKVAADGLVGIATAASEAIGPIGKLFHELDELGKALNDIGPKVPTATDIVNFFTTPAQAAPAATSALLAYTAAMDDLHAAYVAGQITVDEYVARTEALEAGLGAATAANDAVARSSQEAARAFLLGAEGADTLTTAQLKAAQAAANVRTAGTGGADALNDLGLTAQATAVYISRDLAASLEGLKGDLEALPKLTTLEVEIRTRNIAEDAGSRNVAEKVGGVDSTEFDRAQAERAADAKAAADKKAADAKAAGEKAQREADAAARKAQQEADKRSREHAAIVHDQLNTAYDKLKDTAKDAFDAIHQGNLKSIDDAHKAANAALDDQAKAIRGRVTGEQARIQKLRDDRRERELRDDVANAKPEDRAAAVQALTDFLDDQRIARMQTDADVAIAGLDVEKAKNDAIAAADKEREDSRYKGQVKAFENELKALKHHLDNSKGNWGAYFNEIAKLAKRAGVDALLGIKPVAGLPASPKAPKSGKAALVDGIDSSSAGAGKVYEGQVIHNHFYVDGREVAFATMDRMASDAAIRNPTHASTGNLR